MPDANSIDRYIPVTPVVLEILVALGDGPRHGYALAQEVRERSGGRVRLETGPLYRHLKRLLDEGLIEETPERPDDHDERRGAYYKVTTLGLRVVVAESGRLDELVSRARRLRFVDGSGT